MADSLLDGTVDNTSESLQQQAREELFNKWKDKPLEEVLKAKVESDLFIKTQNARLDDLRNDYLKLREEATAKASLEELIKRQESLLANPDKTVIPPTEEPKPSLKSEDIDSILEQKLTQREKLTKQTENFNFVRAKLREQFGDKASEVLKQRMDTLGLDQTFTDDLAKTHPQVFMRTFGLEETSNRQQDSAPPRSSQRQNQFAPVVKKRDWNYYQELKKTNPRIYLDPKIAIQMHNDAIELGEAFGMPEN